MLKAKKIICIIAILMCVFIVPVSAFETHSEYYYVTSPISQPQVSESFSYVEIVCQDKYTWHVYSYVFLISFSDYSEPPTCGITFTDNGLNNDSITFTNISDGIMQFVRVRDNGAVLVSSAIAPEQSVVESNYVDIVSAKVYGSVFISPQSFDTNTLPFVTVYGSDKKSIELLENIKSLLLGLGNITQNQNENTDKIIGNQNENADKIINNQNQLQQQEKDDITNSGNSSSESVDDIPNQSEGFLSSLTNLTNAMSYNGTECKWKLPNVYIPAISNIVPRIDLISEKDIDFGFWVERIPSNILSLIRAVCTLALIVFCFKELYNTISYVLTLKGGNN